MSPALENPTEKKQPPVTGHAFVRDLDGRCDKRRGDYYRCGEKADDPIHAVPPITEGRK
jgi:hypothetical protein